MIAYHNGSHGCTAEQAIRRRHAPHAWRLIDSKHSLLKRLESAAVVAQPPETILTFGAPDWSQAPRRKPLERGGAQCPRFFDLLIDFKVPELSFDFEHAHMLADTGNPAKEPHATPGDLLYSRQKEEAPQTEEGAFKRAVKRVAAFVLRGKRAGV